MIFEIEILIQDFKKAKNEKPADINLLFIEEIIAPLGLNIIRAKNGKELIDLFNENPYISLILMDIKMPVLSGFEAAKIIKERKPDMPIIAQSAYALEHEKAKYELTFDEYLTKPLDKVELTRKISKHIHICISPNK